jgi:hypothetical protein
VPSGTPAILYSRPRAARRWTRRTSAEPSGASSARHSWRKYRQGATGRISDLKAVGFFEDTAQKTAIVDAVLDVAAELGVPASHVAIAWMRQQGARATTSVGRDPVTFTLRLLSVAGDLDLRSVRSFQSRRHFALPAPRCGLPY